MRHHAAHRMFAHPDVNNIRIAFGNGNRANRTGLKKSIGDIPPRDAHVIGLPKASARGAHVVSAGIAHYTAARVGTPAAKRPDRTPFHSFEYTVVIIRRRTLRSLREKLAD